MKNTRKGSSLIYVLIISFILMNMTSMSIIFAMNNAESIKAYKLSRDRFYNIKDIGEEYCIQNIC